MTAWSTFPIIILYTHFQSKYWGVTFDSCLQHPAHPTHTELAVDSTKKIILLSFYIIMHFLLNFGSDFDFSHNAQYTHLCLVVLCRHLSASQWSTHRGAHPSSPFSSRSTMETPSQPSWTEWGGQAEYQVSCSGSKVYACLFVMCK